MPKEALKMAAAALLSLSLFAGSLYGDKTVAAAETKSSRIDLANAAVTDENIPFLHASYTVSADALFNQQELLPMTPDGEMKDISGITGKNWSPNLKKEYGDVSCIVDLGANYVITDIGVVDKNGSPDITFSTGTPGAWESLLTVSLSKYNQWRVFSYESAKPTRYVHVSSNLGDSGIGELAFYGYKVSELSAEQRTVTGPEAPVSLETLDNLTAGEKIGCNVFIDDPLSAILVCRNVREYHNLSWLIKEDGTIRFTFGTWADCDSFYRMMKDNGISLIPCLQGTCDVIRGHAKGAGETVNNLPIADGADSLDPKSYAIHANAMYNFAARYGSNKDIDLSTLNVSSDQPAKVGLNLLTTLENSNEQNKGWEGKASYFTPYEFAAMCSADYDGHEGTIENAGVKTADKNFKLAMGGLVGGDHIIEYLSLMKTWFDYNRTDGKFAVDVINVHMSPTDDCPENSAFTTKIQKVKDWIAENAPGTELWISEFEIDAKDKIVEGTDSHKNEAFEQARADRILRTYLLALAEDVDRITMFQLRDEWSGVYANSGLVTGKGEWNKKLAWYYTFCLGDVLKNADFSEVIEASDSIYIYKFEDRETKEPIYCLWTPTTNGSVLEDYRLLIPEQYGNVTLITPKYNEAEGVRTALTRENGSVKVTVSETPCFVKLSGKKTNQETKTQKLLLPDAIQLGNLCEDKFDKSEVCRIVDGAVPADKLLTEFSHLFDETERMPATPFGALSELLTPETTMASVTWKYPMDCILYYDEAYTFTFSGFYDSLGTGSFEIYDDVTDTLLYTSDLSNYKRTVIEKFPKEVTTNRLRIVRYNDAKMNSLMLFGYELAEEIPEEPVEGLLFPASIQLGSLCEKKFDKTEICDLTKPAKDRLLNEFTHLFDERERMPATPTSSYAELAKPVTTVGSVTWKYPMDLILTFDEAKQFTQIGYFDSFGVGTFEIYDDETNTLIFSTDLSCYQQTVITKLTEPVTTSRLRIVRYNDSKINSLMLYGY